jgi:chemotaxis signal transduction protein
MKKTTNTNAAARLLDVPVTDEYLAEAARRYAQPKAETRSAARSAIVFRLAGEWLALRAAVFQEIAPLRPMHSLPHRRDTVVTGVVNIRGELLVCVALEAALGLAAPAGAHSPQARHAVLGRGTERFVFVAEEIVGLHRFDERELGPVPATLAHQPVAHTRGFFSWQQHAVGLLDDARLFQTLNRRLA